MDAIRDSLPVEASARKVRVGGIETRLLEAGAHPSETIAFVHGNPGPGEEWRGLLGRAGRVARAIAMDMPAFGSAAPPGGFDYTIQGYARYLGQLFDSLGARRIHLVLHDFGGGWGLSWAAEHLARVASLTLINTGVLRGYRWHYLAKVWRTPLLGELALRATSRAGLRLALRHGRPRRLPEQDLERIYRQLKQPHTQVAVLRLYRATDLDRASVALHQRLAGTQLPTLVLWGARDAYLPPRYAERQRETFPQAEVVRLAESGHWPFLDDADGVARHLLPFLERHVAPRQGTG